MMTDLTSQVAEMRRFNRFYTQLIGVLDEGHLESPYSLVQVRVLYELAHRPDQTAAELCERLGLDGGYTSRLVHDLQRRGLVVRRRSTRDRRAVPLALTAKGARVAAALERDAAAAVERLLATVPAGSRTSVISAMQRIRATFVPEPATVPYVLAMPRAGDLGWIVHRHGVLYAEEYGWDERFEGLVARVVADFAAEHDPRRERCWVAERTIAGERRIVGSVFVVARSRTVAQLRLLYVEPDARGLGIGARLVQECTRFARQVGYRKIMLWTNSVLVSARRIYEAEGYHLVEESPHAEFGTDLVGQTWELALT